MLRFFRRWFGIGRLPGMPALVRGERILFRAEGVRTVKRFSGHVPGLRARGDGRDHWLGAFVITNARVVATVGRHTIVNAGFDRAVGSGPTTVSLARDGLHVTWDLDRVHTETSGRLAVRFEHPVPDDVLRRLPYSSVRFPADPQSVVRLAGSLGRLPDA